MNEQRIAIYNRWLATLGGGEKYGLTIAEHLSRKHLVQVISHKPVAKNQAEERLNLDLSRVEFKTIPECRASEISALTADYDLFINASYMDFFPSFAKTSATVIYFPAKFGRRIAFRRNIKLVARKAFKLPSFIAGIHSFDPIDSSIIWETEPVVKVQLPASRTPYRIRFMICSRDPMVKRISISLNNENVGHIDFQNNNQWETYDILVPTREGRDDYHDLTVQVEDNIQLDGQPKLGITAFWLSLPEFRFYHTLFEQYFKEVGRRLQYYPPGTSMLDYIDTYGMIWAISEYSRKWIKRYWHRQSEILYPPVDLQNLRPGEKSNKILNVGRFFAGQHNKKHLDLIAAFKLMVDRGLRGWEFHLAGGTTPGDENHLYLEQVKEVAQGYPIIIHPDIPYNQLVDLYDESSIYWHASGFGEDEKRNPEKFEHFGITTVEAMAAGCAPVVIAKGGQPEIVEHGQTGFLWRTLDELQSYSLQLIRDPMLRERISVKAIQSSNRYDKDHFNARLEYLLGKMSFPI